LWVVVEVPSGYGYGNNELSVDTRPDSDIEQGE
jgi:hypothetical protein